MRVTLEIIDGPELGRVIRLADREVRQIGRTEWADVALSGDDLMSSVHFSIESDGQICRLRDLESSNGTEVNGRPVVEHVLCDGDTIIAGKTTFRASVEGGAEGDVVSAAQATVAASVAAKPIAVKRGDVTYTSEDCATGLKLYRGMSSEIAPAHIADMISRHIPLVLLVDFKKLGQPKPENLTKPDYLFDWFPEKAAETVSPVILAASEAEGWFELLEQGWGTDAIVCLFSRTDPVELRAHLRAQVRTDEDTVVGYCWPTVLAPMLMYFGEKAVQKLVAGIDAVLVEFPDLPETWQIFATDAFTETFQSFGFKEQAPDEVGAAEPEDESS